LHGSKKSLPTPSAEAAAINLLSVLCSNCSTLFRDVSRKSRRIMQHAETPTKHREIALFDPRAGELLRKAERTVDGL
jgi:hypothetical protein